MRRLPDRLVDQIAAGEVVERPASVVKELVENALDAGAGRVRVEVRGGGCDFIAVDDDGCGMTPADARRALERHATSKITCVDDLERIASYGFRGEALPAIASVSHLLLRSRARGAREATEIRVEAGRVVSERASGAPEGTRVEVSELFGAVPARRKFLKKPSTEWGHAVEWLTRAALARPRVHFEIRRDARPPQVWAAVSDPLDRIAAAVSEADAAAFVPVTGRAGPLALEGFASRPDRHRPTQAGIHLFVNRRPVRDRVLQHALLEIYRDWLPRGRFPAAVLFLEVPPDAVDVNVHPAKSEVRFVDPRAVHRLVREGVRAAIGERRWLGGAPEVGVPVAAGAEPAAISPAPRPGWPPAWAGKGQGGDAGLWGRAGLGEGRVEEAFAPGADGAAAGPGAGPGARFGELPLLGQLLATYLVLESKDRLLLVDQHAAHERVLYEGLRAEWTRARVASQGLLAPVAVGLEPALLGALGESGEALEKLGFEVEAFGEATAVVRAVPALLGDRDPGELVRGLAEELREAGAAADPLRAAARSLEAADRLFASLACHSARRKGERLEPREQQALLDALDAIPWAPTCPHGRPVVVAFELAEIERRFARR